VFTVLLPGTGNGADHIENTSHVILTQRVHWPPDCCLATSYNIHSIVACAYRGVFIKPLPDNVTMSQYCDTTPESCYLPICWAGLRWARSCGNTEGAAAGQTIVGTRFHSNEYDWRSNPLHTEWRRFLGNAYRNVSVHTATNPESTVTAQIAITLLVKEVASTRFAGGLLTGEFARRIRSVTHYGIQSLQDYLITGLKRRLEAGATSRQQWEIRHPEEVHCVNCCKQVKL
jgi:hypothetical protein